MITMATKAPCCLGDGSQVLEPIPSIQSEREVMEVGGGGLGTEWERMGFLLWQPQLLYKLWDQVSSGNNQRPLEKIHSEPGNRQRQ